MYNETMYNELIKNLRVAGDFVSLSGYQRDLMREAADAIEELSRVADAIPHVCECCIGCEVESGGCDRAFVLSPKRAREYLSEPSWIPVTEALPEKTGKYLVCGQWGEKPAETWVCELIAFGTIKGWANEARNPAVTHWMPLPPPPKEEA